MRKFTHVQYINGGCIEPDEHGEYYLCSEVDTVIADLERDNRSIATLRVSANEAWSRTAKLNERIAELEEAMRKAIECMNGGAYGIAAVTLSAALDPPTSSL